MTDRPAFVVLIDPAWAMHSPREEFAALEQLMDGLMGRFRGNGSWQVIAPSSADDPLAWRFFAGEIPVEQRPPEPAPRPGPVPESEAPMEAAARGADYLERDPQEMLDELEGYDCAKRDEFLDSLREWIDRRELTERQDKALRKTYRRITGKDPGGG